MCERVGGGIKVRAASVCSDNELGAEGATALSSCLTALTNLQSINVR